MNPELFETNLEHVNSVRVGGERAVPLPSDRLGAARGPVEEPAGA